MKKNAFLLILMLLSGASFAQTKADSIMYLSPYVVVGPSSTPVNITGSYAMYVPKGILTEKLRVAVRNSFYWADFVFDKGYPLMPLPQLETYIKKNQHLPGVPTTEEAMKQGIDVGEIQKILLQKVEELTLHIIDQDKKIAALQKSVQGQQR